MASSLYAYRFTAHKKFERSPTLYRMNELRGSGEGGDFLDQFDRVIYKEAEYPPPPEDGDEDLRGRISLVEDVRQDKRRRIRYGRISIRNPASVRYDLEHRESGATVRVAETDREGRPLFFWLTAPTRSDSALLLTERAARFSIVRGFWENHVARHLREAFTDTKIDFGYYNPDPVWRMYEESGRAVEGITIRRVIEETDESKEDIHPSRTRVIAKVDTVVSRRLTPDRHMVARIFERKDAAKAVELIAGDLHLGVNAGSYDEVIVPVDIDGRKRNVRIGRIDVAQLGYPVENVGMDRDGYPKVGDMAKFAERLARDIGKPLGFRI